MARAGCRSNSAPELAVSRFAQRDDIDGEISAIFHLGHIAWWHEDYDLMVHLLERGTQLAAAGSDLAASIVTLGPLVLGEVLGDADAVVAEARSSRREHPHPEIVPLTDFLEARAHLTNGDPRAALAPATRACEAATPTMRPPAEFERLSCLWALGHRDAVVARIDSAMTELEEVGWLHNRAANGAQAALWLCVAGDVDGARSMLDRANLVRDSAGAWARALVSMAEVMLRLGTGDEPGAAVVMQSELAARPLADPSVVRAHRAWLPLTYVLVPESRQIWDSSPLRGSVAQGRAASRAIVALREGAPVDSESLRGFELAALRAQMPVPWLAELATLFAAQGQQGDAEELLHGVKDALVRTRLRDLSKHAPKTMRAAASGLLGSHAVPPERSVRVCVLGPLRLDFDGHDEWPSQLNRKAVRRLLLLLVEHGPITRTRVGSLLWPDLDDDAVRNNLRVTLTYLTQALQPDRLAHEPSHFIEDFGDAIRLRPGASLQLDIVEFHEALHRAAGYERRGAASYALGEYRRAVALYRGDHLASVDDAEWAFAARERERLAFVKAAVRAGELSLARGDFEEATELALRSVSVDPWSEPARRLLADARMVGGDRSGALRSLDDCARMLADLGIDAEPETRILARRVGFRGL